MLRRVKQWQDGFEQPAGQLHSEHRMRHTVPVRQQNHSPEVVQPCGQPPPWTQVLQGYAPAGLSWSQRIAGDQHGLHGPPPQPTHWFPSTEPTETPVLVRKRPVPSEPAARNLKSCRRDDFRARA
jgi:hypothetical protein